LGAIDMPLSLKTTRRGLPRWPAWFSASNDIPEVAAPSPMIATTRAPLPVRRAASTMPSAADTDVPAWPAPNASYALSSRRRKPLGPSAFLILLSPARRPVSALCP
jgi:hypothetical protein